MGKDAFVERLIPLYVFRHPEPQARANSVSSDSISSASSNSVASTQPSNGSTSSTAGIQPERYATLIGSITRAAPPLPSNGELRTAPGDLPRTIIPAPLPANWVSVPDENVSQLERGSVFIENFVNDHQSLPPYLTIGYNIASNKIGFTYGSSIEGRDAAYAVTRPVGVTPQAPTELVSLAEDERCVKPIRSAIQVMNCNVHASNIRIPKTNARFSAIHAMSSECGTYHKKIRSDPNGHAICHHVQEALNSKHGPNYCTGTIASVA
ncbi:hypothetical protein AAVH_23016 [Aphelenchoides avenae]|nr:hypothetical protein AAVH_23016 [Aphelenchus avenae]